LINCTDESGINVDRFAITRTVEGYDVWGEPNLWSIRPPVNDKAESYTDGYSIPQILRADGRGYGRWYDSLFSDNFTYAVCDNSSPRVTITNGSTWAVINFSWQVEPSSFRQSVFLSRKHIEEEEKKEYYVNKNDYILIKFWDLMHMRGDINYSICVLRNVYYINSPHFPLRAYYCNSSYDPYGGVTVQTSPNCVYLYSIPPSELDVTYYASKNSSYSKNCFKVNNGEISGVKTSDIYYVMYESITPNVKSYTVRYVNGSSGTNVSFSDSGVAWISTDAGETWIPANFTPDVWFSAIIGGDQLQIGDVWFSAIIGGDQLQIGVYVEDVYRNAYSNYSIVVDTIGYGNHPITYPDILYYYSPYYGYDYELNGMHKENMTIRVGVSRDPNGEGTVNHSLYLLNPVTEEVVYVINNSFYSPEDVPVDIIFDTTKVADGYYKMKVVAVADDDPNDIKEFVTPNAFLIRNLVSGGGGGGTLESFDIGLCNYTYHFILEHTKKGIFNYTYDDLLQLIELIKNETGIRYSEFTVVNYIEKFDYYCYGYQFPLYEPEDVICNYTYYYIKEILDPALLKRFGAYLFYPQDVLNVQEIIKNETGIIIDKSIIEKYFNLEKFNEICGKYGFKFMKPFTIATVDKKRISSYVFLAVLLLVLIIIIAYKKVRFLYSSNNNLIAEKQDKEKN